VATDLTLTLAERQSQEQEAADAEAVARMEAVAHDAYAVAAAALAVLLKRLAKARRDGVTVDARWVRQVGRLIAGMGYAVDLVESALPTSPMIPTIRPAVRDNLDNLVARLADGSPLDDHLRRTIADEATDALADRLARSIVDGVSPASMAEDLAKELALSHTRAATILRTESLRVLRETTRQTYEANPLVVESWTWVSALDWRTCPACAIMHGTRHPVTETLDGHPRCRCAMVPDTVSYASLGIVGVPDPDPVPLGVDWVMALEAEARRALLGPAKYAALEAGEVTLLDFVARRWDPRWGTMRAERSLLSIRQGRNANWGGLGDELGPRPRSVPANA
jgi:SPP1 gp7 family putative phage head morphogenesis protein